jgi:hypothetical protein
LSGAHQSAVDFIPNSISAAASVFFSPLLPTEALRQFLFCHGAFVLPRSRQSDLVLFLLDVPHTIPIHQSLSSVALPRLWFTAGFDSPD